LQFNQDLYSSSGVQLAASSSASGSSHSPCSPILPPSVSANAAAAAVAAAHNSAAAAVAAVANQASSSGLQLGAVGGVGVGVGSGPASGLLGSNVPGGSNAASAGLGMSPVLSGAGAGHGHGHSRTHQTKEEDLIVPRSEAEGKQNLATNAKKTATRNSFQIKLHMCYNIRCVPQISRTYFVFL